MASNAFDFVDDNIDLPCKPTAKFPTTKFEADSGVAEPAPKVVVQRGGNREVQQGEERPIAQQPPTNKPTSPKTQQPTVSFNPVEGSKVVAPPKTLKPATKTITKPTAQKTSFKPSTATGPRTVVPAKEDLENNSSLLRTTNKCNCNCKCWQVAGRK